MTYKETLPEVTGQFPRGTLMLERLIKQADALTALVTRMRQQNPDQKISYNAVIHRVEFMALEIFTDLNPALFRFTGYAITVNPDAFFATYEQTEEGEKYKDFMMQNAPGLYGKFTYQHFTDQKR